MAEQCEEERVSSGGGGSGESISSNNLCLKETSIFLSETIASSSSPVLMPSSISDEPSALLDSRTVTKVEIRTTKETTIFPPSALSLPPSRAYKRPKQHTYDDYDSTGASWSPQHVNTRTILKTISVKHENTDDTEDNRQSLLAIAEQRKIDVDVARKELYHDVSQKVIEKIYRKIEIGAGDTKSESPRLQTISYVAEIIENFMAQNSLKLMAAYQPLYETAPFKFEHRHLEKKSAKFRHSVLASTAEVRKQSRIHPEYYARILPIDIFDRLTDDPNDKPTAAKRCGADKVTESEDKKAEKDDGRCKNRRTEIDYQLARHRLRKLVSIPKPCELWQVAKLLVDIVEAAFCSSHHRSRARFRMYELCNHFYKAHKDDHIADVKRELAQFELWYSKILRSFAKPEDGVKIEGVSQFKCIQDNTDGLETCQSVLEAQGQISVAERFTFEQQNSYFKSLNVNPKEFRTAGNLSHKHLRPYKTKEDPLREVLISQVAQSSLTESDRKKVGKVYVYWNEGDFGWVKIGYTTQSTADRLEEWTEKCGYEVGEHTTEFDYERTVRYPRRVEALAHADLKDHRYEEPDCEGCGKLHNEWFNVDARDAQAVVKKWTMWVQSEDPYDGNGEFKSSIELPEDDAEDTKVVAKDDKHRKTSTAAGTHPMVRRSQRRS